jgi:hypothetical protein
MSAASGKVCAGSGLHWPTESTPVDRTLCDLFRADQTADRRDRIIGG